MTGDTYTNSGTPCTCHERINSFCDACLRSVGIDPTQDDAPAIVKQLFDDVDEYLHWRKVNQHIKGGENYLKRLRESLLKMQPLMNGELR